jgi:hypothetical protein
MDAALSQLRSQGAEVKPEDVARLSPLADKHFKVLGRYHFTANDSILVPMIVGPLKCQIKCD